MRGGGSKAVVVEKKKRRVVAPGASGGAAPSAATLRRAKTAEAPRDVKSTDPEAKAAKAAATVQPGKPPSAGDGRGGAAADRAAGGKPKMLRTLSDEEHARRL
ncbi:MAG: hypothetical protein AAGI70_13060, partial [Pseudomonadota bacterium]